MGSRMRVPAGLLGAALVLVPLAACSDASTSGGTEASSAASAAGSPPPQPGGGTTAGASSGAAGSAGGSGSASDVDCSAGTCSLTLTGAGAEAAVLGTSVVLGRTADGQASFRLSGMDASCGAGESTSVGSFTVECTTVTDTALTLTLRRR